MEKKAENVDLFAEDAAENGSVRTGKGKNKGKYIAVHGMRVDKP